MLSLLHGYVSRRLLGLAFVGLLLINIGLFSISVEPVSAPPPPILTFKWRVNPGNTRTLNAPLAADLIPNRLGLEIVVAGGATSGDVNKANSNGNITVIDGNTGERIWSVRPAPIGIHIAFEIHDLDKDGTPEIVVVAYDKVIALRNDGSIYWTVNAEPRSLVGPTYPAIADIDGDGYVEIFVGGYKGPQVGYDYVYRISHTGSIEAKAPISWHPCYGGLTIGDTNGDGEFELYQGDRSVDYYAWGDYDGDGDKEPDPFIGGGHGVNRIDPYTLQRVWEARWILSSSHAPVLADVDKDGVLDVIAINQPGGGIHTGKGLVVLNATDGSVLTTGGKYRNSTDVDVWGHSQPTVYDIDSDGNLELIASYPWADGGSYTTVWDLYDWRLETYLKDEYGRNLLTGEPPKVGDLTGDGKMEIIAVTGPVNVSDRTYQSNAIYIYNGTSDRDYDLLEKVTDAGGVQLNGPRPFTLLQDVDGDDKNELILTSLSGNIYAYDANQSPAPSPRVRSGLQFYSEYKRGAAEYVPPPGTSQPHYTINLQSRQDTNATTNLGSITFDGAVRNLPNSVSKIAGVYSAQYSANPSYAFDHWAKTGSISLSDANANPTTVTVSGNGTLEAVYLDSAYLFESGFETGYFSSEWDGTIKTSGETATVVDTLHYEGSYSARFTSNGGGGSETALVYKNLSPAMSELYARAYVYVDTNGVQDTGDANWFISFRNVGGTGLAWAGWKKYNNVLYWALMIRNGVSYVTSFTGAPVTGRWYSVELRWAMGVVSGYGELWVDDLLQASIYNKDTDDYGDTSRVRFGMELFNSAPTIAYIDYAIIYEESSGPSSYTVNLVSEEDTVASSNLGSITFNGTPYTLPNGISTPAGSYSAQYSAALGYIFDHWAKTGSVSISSANANPTTVTVSGNGVLKAVYKKISYTIGLESEQNNNATISLGSIKFDSVSYTLPNSTSKTAGTYSIRYYSAAHHKFVRWEATGSIYVADTNAIATNATVTGNGTVKAVYNDSPYISESDFETGDFGEWNGTSVSVGENAVVVGTLSREGTYSARFTSNGGGGSEIALVYKNLSPVMSELYARAYVYVDTTGIADHNDAHWFISFRGSQGLAWAGWYQTGGKLYWALQIRNGASWVKSYTGTPATGTWYSVELHWIKNGTNGYGELWVDGKLQASLINKDTDDFGDASVVRFGLELTACASTTVYIDSAIIDDKYIGRLNKDPTIDSYAPTDTTPEVNEGESLAFNHTSSDLDGDSLTYSWLLDNVENATSQNWAYSPGYDKAGTHNITLVVSDGFGGFASQQWTLTVTDVNRAPVIDSYYPLVNATISEGGSQEFNVTYSDPDGDILTVQWYLNGTPTVATDSYTFSADFGSAGFYNITVEVSDGLASATREWTLTVTDVNVAPVIDSFTPADTTPEVNEGESLNFTHTSSDLDGDSLTYSWLLDSIENATSQNWTYSPGFSEAGTHNVTLVVSDGFGGFASQQWNVTVNDVYTIYLDSLENTSSSFSSGSITFDSVIYALPDNASKLAGNYTIQYNADAGYEFDHWEFTPGTITVDNVYSASTIATVSGDGTLKAVYKAVP